MVALRITIIVACLFGIAGITNAQDVKQYVGKSPCMPELQSEYSNFSLRLDKSQNLSLLTRDLPKSRILMIIQPTGDINHCGVIRDIVQIRHLAKGFELRCFDQQAPADVIIGTAIRKRSTKDLAAIEAWRIDLKEIKFVEIRHKVTCSADGWNGDDDGGDLGDEAKKYAAHGKPGQFGPESK